MSRVLNFISKLSAQRTPAHIIGDCGIAVAAIILAMADPLWTVIGAGGMVLLYVFTAPALAISFGQFLIIAVEPMSIPFVALVEGGFLLSLAMKTAFADRQVGGGATVALAIGLGGVFWYTVTALDVVLWLGTLWFVVILGVSYYLLHRYLLVRLRTITPDASSNEAGFHE